MKFFVDTADTADIRDLAESGLVDGVTTNPSLIAKAGRNFLEVVAEICTITPGPVSAEVVALDHETMMREAEILRKIADNVAVKVPLTIDGLKTCKALTDDGTMVNVTLCFSANQALLAAKAGADALLYVRNTDDLSKKLNFSDRLGDGSASERLLRILGKLPARYANLPGIDDA